MGSIIECSLRAAIEESNAREYGAALVEFDFKNVSGDVLISPTSPLPVIKKRFILAHPSNKGQNIILSGINAGASHGLHAQTTSKVSLSGFQVSSFKKNGVFMDSGAPLYIENMTIKDNGWYGVESGGSTKISGTKNRQAAISGNGYAGVRIESEGFTRSVIKFVDIHDNGDAGIHSDKGQIKLVATRLFNNGAEGFVSTGLGNCNSKLLTTEFPAFELGASITVSSFSNNAGAGIYIETGSLRLQPGTEISNNADSGVILKCGSLTSGEITTPNERKTKITGNGSLSSCFRTENEKRVSYACNGGGVELRGEASTLISSIDDVQILDNKGFGLFNTTQVHLYSVEINNNNGPGVFSDLTTERTGGGKRYLLNIAGNHAYIQNNKAEGVRVEIGNVKIMGNSTIGDNMGTGIFIAEGDLDIVHDQNATSTLIQSNGSTGNCVLWMYDENTEELSKSTKACTKGGILLSQGDLSSINLKVKNNTGFGLNVSGDATLSGTQICGNSNNLTVSGRLSGEPVNSVCDE